MVDMSLTKDEATAEADSRLEIHKRWRALETKVTTEIAEAMTELEDNFRKLLGDK